ncbi:MAG: hypothetical protein IPK82_02780 [Polyangiaceae bacterium]|nr:hypothetical protein [Polyangiaceae bacterium]
MTSRAPTDGVIARPPKRGWAGVALAVASIACLLAINYYANHGVLWLANGLNLAVVVELDGEPIKVDAESRRETWTSTGVHRVRILREDGTVIDEDAFVIDHWGIYPLNVYNVSGAASIFLKNVEYSKRGAKPDQDQNVADFSGGKRFLSVAHVAYPFETPPTSINSESYGTVIKKHAEWRPGGYKSTFGYLADRRSPAMVDLMGSLAKALPDTTGAFAAFALNGEPVVGTAAIAQWAAEQKKQSPDNQVAHRAYQNAMIRMGRREDVTREYQEAYEKGGKTPEDAILLARLLPHAEALPLLTGALQTYPSNVSLHGRLGVIALHAREYEKAISHFALATTGRDYPELVEHHAAALLGLGKGDEAAGLLARWAEVATIDASVERMYALAVLATPGSKLPPWRFVDRRAEKFGSADYKFWARSLTAEPPSFKNISKDTAQVIGIHAGVFDSPKTAWKACNSASPNLLRNVDSTVALLFAAEFVRIGDLTLAGLLFIGRQEFMFTLKDLEQYIHRGTEVPGFEWVGPSQRAALEYVRYRALAAEGKLDGQLLATAARRDVWKSLVSYAVKSWPSPQSQVPITTQGRGSGSKGSSK